MSFQFIDRTKALLRDFSKADRGNVMLTFALAMVPMIGLVGAAVDYSRGNSDKAAMQAAVDAAALMLAKSVATMTQEQMNQKAQEVFSALFNRTDVQNLTVTPEYTSSGGSQLVLRSTATVPTTFMRILGATQMNLDVSSTVKWGTNRLRVALVLDTTGSMESAGKITALQNATKNLLDQLQAAATQNGDVYVSIIPFSKNVNVGASNYNANWIDWTQWEAPPSILANWIANNTTTWEQTGPGDSCPFSNGTHGFRCAPTPTSTSTTNNVPSNGSYDGYICPSTDTGQRDSTKIGIMYNGCYNSVSRTREIDSGNGASCGNAANCSCSGSGRNRACTQQYYSHTWVKNARSTWNGCVTDRGTATGPSQDYDRKVTAPSTSITASLFPAEQNSYCSPQIMGLNYDWANMKSLANSLYPLGATSQPIGLVWGWQSLVGGGPLTAPPKDPNYSYNDVIVLMSDGLNTLNRWYGNGSTTNTMVDSRMYESATVGTCANIKATGVTIYTVHVNTDGDPMSNLLKNCASGNDKFWMITSASELNGVFAQIGTNLSRLRVAR